MKLLMIDNYDSFTYNLVQYFGELGAQVETVRNDEIDVAQIGERIASGVTRLVISPGPCSPAEAGVSVAAINAFAGRLPILGVCLGHQAIGAAFGGHIVRAQQLMHGKTSEIRTTGNGVFAGLPERFTVNRYHSLSIERTTCPEVLETTAWTDDDEIMGVRHTGFAHDVRIEGVQFHPESILTEHGHAMLKNFLGLNLPPRLRPLRSAYRPPPPGATPAAWHSRPSGTCGVVSLQFRLVVDQKYNQLFFDMKMIAAYAEYTSADGRFD